MPLAMPGPIAVVHADHRRRVSPAQFIAMLVSRRRLVRVDQPKLGLRGLQDVETNELFEIEERKLLGVDLWSDSFVSGVGFTLK